MKISQTIFESHNFFLKASHFWRLTSPANGKEVQILSCFVDSLCHYHFNLTDMMIFGLHHTRHTLFFFPAGALHWKKYVFESVNPLRCHNHAILMSCNGKSRIIQWATESARKKVAERVENRKIREKERWRRTERESKISSIINTTVKHYREFHQR